MGHCHHTVRSHDASLHDVHVLPANRVIKAEELCIRGGHFKGGQLRHGAPPLVRYVVDHQQTARVCHLPVVPVVSLQHDAVFTITDCGGFSELSFSEPGVCVQHHLMFSNSDCEGTPEQLCSLRSCRQLSGMSWCHERAETCICLLALPGAAKAESTGNPNILGKYAMQL